MMNYVLHIGVSDLNGKFNQPIWNLLFKWLIIHINNLIFETSYGGRNKIVSLCPTKCIVEDAESPSPDMEIEAFKIIGESSVLGQILQNVEYNSDSLIEYIFGRFGDREVFSLNVEDDNYIILHLNIDEVRDLIRGLGDLEWNTKICEKNTQFIDYVFESIPGKDEWLPLSSNL